MKLFGFYGVRFRLVSFEVEINHRDRYVCSIGVCQQLEYPITDTVRIDPLRRIEITNLCAVFDCRNASYCPGPDSLDCNPLHFWSDGLLEGPFYSYGCAHIDKECKSVRVSFTASLIDRESGAELTYKVVDTTLRR